jgi:MFS family permease
MLYLGSFTGYIILSYFADNFGRKQMHLVSWLIAIAGIITLTCSFSIQHVGVGLFLCGMGINTSITLQFTFIKEFVYGNAK